MSLVLHDNVKTVDTNMTSKTYTIPLLFLVFDINSESIDSCATLQEPVNTHRGAVAAGRVVFAGGVIRVGQLGQWRR